MKIKLIEHLRPGFSEGAGPYEIKTIGFRVGLNHGDSQDYILGEVYIGPHMSDKQLEWYEKTKHIIELLEKLTQECG